MFAKDKKTSVGITFILCALFLFFGTGLSCRSTHYDYSPLDEKGRTVDELELSIDGKIRMTVSKGSWREGAGFISQTVWIDNLSEKEIIVEKATLFAVGHKFDCDEDLIGGVVGGGKSQEMTSVIWSFFEKDLSVKDVLAENIKVVWRFRINEKSHSIQYQMKRTAIVDR